VLIVSPLLLDRWCEFFNTVDRASSETRLEKQQTIPSTHLTRFVSDGTYVSLNIGATPDGATDTLMSDGFVRFQNTKLF